MQKTAIDISFAKGLDTKTDPWRVAAGNFLRLENSVFDKGGMLKKRNGYSKLAALPNTTSTYLTTLNDNLTAIGPTISALNASDGTWVTKGTIKPLKVNTLPLIRNSINQTSGDACVAPNGLVCTAYVQNNNSVDEVLYAISDSVTGQNIVAPTPIPVVTGTPTGTPRVFLLDNHFVIVFTNVILATPHLQYITISASNPSVTTTAQDIATAYVSATTVAWDGIVANNRLYIAYNTTSGGQSVKVTYLSVSAANLGQTPATPTVFSGAIATMMSLAADITNQVVYISYYSPTTGHTAAVDLDLNVIFTPQTIISSGTVLNLASYATGGVLTVYSEVSPVINAVTVTGVNSTPTVGTPYTVVRSVGLASKTFVIDGVVYALTAYSSTYQPTYFLLDLTNSTEASPKVIAKLAYQNGGGLCTAGLPSVCVNGTVAQFMYLFKDFVAAQNTVSATPTANAILGVYSQTGIKLASLDFNAQIDAAEIAGNLHIGGGFLWQYDGFLPVENNFFLFPDNITATGSATAGSMTAQQYYYTACYEWEDNQGNVYRSAPAINKTVTLTTQTSVTVTVPYLRLTYKTDSPAKIVIYRWSVAQQTFYRVTSLTNVQLNTTTADTLTFTDTLADSAIVGNDILYTTGGVIENMNAPATNIMTLFDTRLWIVDAEDQNLLWFSKQVIENTPVEMSDLLTYYVPPTTAAQGTTGPITALAPLDDKLIVFKRNAIYYINGSGPDNTGSNNQYSQPIFVTSTVGCVNQQSIVFMPQGLMFQSEKGIWLLGRDLSTNYIGAPVEAFNTSLVQSALNIPETNQVRFTLNTGETLVYDYFYGQWGTFTGVPAISACIYQNMHTVLKSTGYVFKETEGTYTDDTNPVLMKFTTGWLAFAGLQGYQRAYFFYLLGKYYSPHKLYLEVAYDYDPSIQSAALITPNNFSPAYGGNGNDSVSPYGQQLVYGGPSAVENWRVFFKHQRCSSFQLNLTEVYDASLGVDPGAGFTLSGLNVVIGVKKDFRPMPAATSIGVRS